MSAKFPRGGGGGGGAGPFLARSLYDVIFDLYVDSASLATSFKKCNVIIT